MASHEPVGGGRATRPLFAIHRGSGKGAFFEGRKSVTYVEELLVRASTVSFTDALIVCLLAGVLYNLPW